MFTIHHYEQPNRYKFVTLRAARIRRQRKINFVKKWILTPLAIVLFILALGIVGENDRQTEMLEQGYTIQEIK
jgi:hypothetical protein